MTTSEIRPAQAKPLPSCSTTVRGLTRARTKTAVVLSVDESETRSDSDARAPRTRTTATSHRATAAEWIVAELERRGVDTVFGIPGGAILPLYDALAKSKLRSVLARHEQGAGFMAQGVARVRGTAGVCLATSGPGATNLITALADAYADSVPLVAITAQVPRALLGTQAFQEVSTSELARPVTRMSRMLTDVSEVAVALDEAFEVAQGDRQGPVLLDIPKDVLCSPMPSPSRTKAERKPSAVALKQGKNSVERWLDANAEGSFQELARRLLQSRRPLLYVGGGVHWAGACRLVQRVAEGSGAAVVSSLHGLGCLPGEHPLDLGMLGMHGSTRANEATRRADFVLAVGARFDDRATGDLQRFCAQAQIAHIDRDPSEIGRLKPVQLGMAADAGHALRGLLRHVESPVAEGAAREVSAPRTNGGTQQIAANRWLRELDNCETAAGGPAVEVFRKLNALLPDDLWVTTDVGQHQMWTAQHLAFSSRRRLLTSGGLGTMGFGLPAAIGAAMARPGDAVVCVSGDGSLLMNVQELSLLSELQLDVGIVVLNNQQLGMVRQQQQLFYAERYSDCDLPRHDFARIGRAFGVPAERVVVSQGEHADADAETEAALHRFSQSRGPRLMEIVLPEENVLPMVPPGKANADMLIHARAAR